jgi:hypothetical protein
MRIPSIVSHDAELDTYLVPAPQSEKAALSETGISMAGPWCRRGPTRNAVLLWQPARFLMTCFNAIYAYPNCPGCVDLYRVRRQTKGFLMRR